MLALAVLFRKQSLWSPLLQFGYHGGMFGSPEPPLKLLLTKKMQWKVYKGKKIYKFFSADKYGNFLNEGELIAW